MRTIYLCVKHWPNGRVEIPEAWPTEQQAADRCRELVTPGAFFTVSVWTCELKDG